MAGLRQQHHGNTSYIDGGFGTEKGSDGMFDTLEEGYDQGPDKVALICDHQSWGNLRNLVGLDPQAGCLTLTYRQMMRAARDLALVWQDCGIKRGGTLLAFLPVSADWALSFWVAIILDLTFVPLNPMALNIDRWRGHSYPLDLLDPTVVLVPTLREAITFDELYPELNIIVKIVCHEQKSFLHNDWTRLEPPATALARARLIGGQKDLPPRPPRPPYGSDNEDRKAVLLFSQNSPDHPFKGCPLKASNIRTTVVMKTPGFWPRKSFLVTCPSSSSATLEAAMLAWQSGGTLVFPSALFDAPKTLSSVELHNCTNLVCTPSNLEELIKDPSRSTRKLGSLESLVVHGGVVSANLLYRGKEALQSGWATSSLTMAEGLGVFGWFRSWRRPVFSGYSDSIGRVLEGSLAKICHVDDRDNIVSRGQEGLLHIGGETVIEKYIGDVEGERFYQDSEGKSWLITNYLATMDPEGLVRLTSEFKVCSDVLRDSPSIETRDSLTFWLQRTYKPEADGADVSP
ncbi:acetyl-CoA synthetase-like protein [Aureobasidium pullulans]|uniref:Acetyl-CoA synthetase-like protein n=1 Tax=Aureobasidium pullulans TaxID=5580 RepID=A0A4V4JRV2_AURPU|nr:acetyl-CoA synthetase-like protein [Aureobasidium pullulans]